MTEIPSRLGVIPIRGAVFLPGSRFAFKIGRKSSVTALRDSLNSTKHIAAFVQVDPDMENPTMHDLHAVGVLCNVLQQEKKDGIFRVVVEALTRVRVSKLIQSSPYFLIEPAEVSDDLSADEIKLPPTQDIERAANLLKKFAPEGHLLHSIIRPLPYGNEPGKLADYLVASTRTTFPNQLACLFELNPHKRLKLAYKIMVEEGQQAQLESEINDKVTNAIRAEHRGIFCVAS
jgi:ATP-dependent Lon protease